MSETPKRVVYLAVRKKPSDFIEVDPFSDYLTDKQYLDRSTGIYLEKSNIIEFA